MDKEISKQLDGMFEMIKDNVTDKSVCSRCFRERSPQFPPLMK